MMGVVSGMNIKGLTVTLNAARSQIPSEAAMPISLLAREILQYAETIDQAYRIAKKRKTFVNEIIMIGSAHDGKAALIEKGPSQTSLYHETEKNTLICSNHFRTIPFQNDSLRNKDLREGHSLYRYHRAEQLLKKKGKITPEKAVEILRDRFGLNDYNLGMGHEKAMNQMIAHHGIIFQPEKLRVGISTPPYQMGEFVFYDLSKVFSDFSRNQPGEEICEPYNIAPDPFLQTEGWKKYCRYRQLLTLFRKATSEKTKIQKAFKEELINSNPEHFQVYLTLGEYELAFSNFKQAKYLFLKSLSKVNSHKKNIEKIKKYIEKCEKN